MVEARAHGQYGKTVEAIDEQPINGVCFLTLWCARALVRGPTDIYPLLAKYSTIVSHNGIHTVPLSLTSNIRCLYPLLLYRFLQRAIRSWLGRSHHLQNLVFTTSGG